MSVKGFVKELNNDKVEGELIKTIFVSLVASFALVAVLYFLTLKSIENFLPKYGLFLFLSILSYSLILLSVRHIRAYKEFACMSGMMIGMTIGAIAGFLPAFYIASTNGMFWGSLMGMASGILFGVWNGKCCGVMGAMEGIMAGFMGGIMGGMTAIMMLNDNLRAAAIVVFVISAVILFGLNYMIYKETNENKMERKHKDNEFFIIFWSVLLTAITTWFMVFGPRSLLFQ